MTLSALAATLVWIYTLVGPPGGVQPDLVSDLQDLRTPRSARLVLAGSAQMGSERIELRGSGAYVQPDRFRLQVEVPALHTSAEQILVGQRLYQRNDGAGEWQVQDVRSLAGELPPGLPIGGPLGGERFDPADLPPELRPLLAQLSASFRTVGQERLAGVLTRHERGELDLLKLAAELGAPAPQGELERLALSLDYWLGLEDRYLHQVTVGAEARPGPAAGPRSEAVRAELTATFSAFDQAISIEAPQMGGAAQPAPVQPAPVQAPRPAPVQIPGRTSGR
jgi:hypothetical protein